MVPHSVCLFRIRNDSVAVKYISLGKFGSKINLHLAASSISKLLQFSFIFIFTKVHSYPNTHRTTQL